MATEYDPRANLDVDAVWRRKDGSEEFRLPSPLKHVFAETFQELNSADQSRVPLPHAVLYLSEAELSAELRSNSKVATAMNEVSKRPEDHEKMVLMLS